MSKVKSPEKIDQATANAKLHKQYVGALTHAFILVAIGVSLTVFTVAGRVTENEFVLVVFYCILYGTSVIGMIWVMLFVGKNRNASIEAIESGSFTADKIVYSIRGEVISRYLRAGVLLFASMSVAFYVSHCFQLFVEMRFAVGNIILNSFRLLFILVQAVFLLVFHRLVILTKTRPFKFLALHLLAANVCTLVHMSWLGVILADQDNRMYYNSEWSVSSSRIMNYFLPTVVEFTVIAVLILYDLARRCGHVNQVKPHRKEAQEFKQKKSVLWNVIAVLLAICVAGLVIGLGINERTLGWIRYLAHMGEVAVICLVGLILCGVGLKTIRRLKFTVSLSRTELEENLLLVTAFATIGYLVASIIICLGHMIMDPSLGWNDTQLLRSQLALVVLQFCHVILQTYFIQDCFYRCCHTQELRQERPGRSIFIMLAAINISLWIIHSFQVKDNDPLHKFSEINARMNKMDGIFNIMLITLPFAMLYYFQSFICLIMAYRRIYEDEVARFERLIRWVNQNRELFMQKNYLETNTRSLVKEMDESDEFDNMTFDRGFDDGALNQQKIIQYNLYREGKTDAMSVAKARIEEAQRNQQAMQTKMFGSQSMHEYVTVEQNAQERSLDTPSKNSGQPMYSLSDSDKEDAPVRPMVYITRPEEFNWDQQEFNDDMFLNTFTDNIVKMQEPSAPFGQKEDELNWEQTVPGVQEETQFSPVHGEKTLNTSPTSGNKLELFPNDKQQMTSTSQGDNRQNKSGEVQEAIASSTSTESQSPSFRQTDSTEFNENQLGEQSQFFGDNIMPQTEENIGEPQPDQQLSPGSLID